MKIVSNTVAWAALGTAKISGMAGLVLGYTPYRVLGGLLLTFAFVMVGMCVTVCLKIMKGQNVQDDSDKAVLKRMMKEGTLNRAILEVSKES